ncbi:ATP-binding protein [Verrucomicrobia bacterium]|nr:ATP-binding protein [Verrucomicrobiota bacterium]
MHDHRQNFLYALGIIRFICLDKLLALCLLIMAESAAHSGSAADWKHFTMSDGLQSAGVAGVTFSSKEKVWLRYQDSNTISEFDGYDIASLQVPDLTASKVYESRSGQIWAIHPTGLHLWSKSEWQSFSLPAIAAAYRKVVQRLRSPVSLIPLQINQCLILANDSLHLFNASPYFVKQVHDLNSSGMAPFSEGMECKNGDVLLAGTGGIIWFGGPAKDIEQTAHRSVNMPEEIQEYQLTTPLENANGVFTFIGKKEGKPRIAVRLEGNKWSWSRIPPKIKLQTYWHDAGGFGWGTSFNGLYTIDIENGSVELSNALEAGLIFDVISDGAGHFWIATSEGLSRQSPSYWQLAHPELGEATVFDIARDRKNHLWMVTEDALMTFDEKGSHTINWPESLERIFKGNQSLFTLPNGWIGVNSGNGPILFSPEANSFRQIKSPVKNEEVIKILGNQVNGDIVVQVSSAQSDSHGIFWTFNGEYFDALEIDFAPDIEASEYFWTTELPPEIWFGAKDGIAYANGKQWVQFEAEEGLRTDVPHCMLELKDGRLWLGAGSYIYELQGNRWVQIYFAREKINDLLEARDGTIWVASNNGVHRYFQKTWLTHNTIEGLPSNTVYMLYEDVTGSVFAATTRGVSRYVPQSDMEAPITNIEIPKESSQKDIKRGTVVTFNSIDKWEHTPNERLLYSYRQDNEVWHPFSYTNNIILGDLPAGVHKIEVQAMDRNGNIEVQPPIFRFNFTIPWNEDPRLMTMTWAAAIITLILTGFAINRHLQLKRSYAEVEKIVDIRTKELEQANKELLQDQKMKALGTLASGIAHDFNSILSIIKGSIQIIEENPSDTDKVRKRVGRMHSVVDQGAGIVQSMLGYVRRKNEPSHLYDLNSVVLEAIRFSKDQQSTQSIEYQANPKIGELKMAPDLVKQILINLINNAADSMDHDGVVSIHLSLFKSFKGHVALKPNKADNYAVLRIMDSGVGISEEIVGRIFEPFYTTKAFSSRRGTGLGLSMVYEMAKEMGNGLSVDSKPGQGSQFFVYFPMEKSYQ